mgnify:CR=1 FL=1
MKHVYLRTRRAQLNMTQEQLEQRSGVAQNTISKLESNALAQPEFRTVMALAAALSVDPRHLKFGPDPKRPPIVRRRRLVA